MILDLLEKQNPSRVALKAAGGGPALTYEQLRSQVMRFANELRRLGIGPGDRVAIALPNGIETIVSFLAATVVGTAAPLNPAYKLDEFRFYLEDTSAKVLVVPRGGADDAKLAANDQTIIVEIEIGDDGKVLYRSSAGPRNLDRPTNQLKDDIALVLHTSGTTSRPKRVPLSHSNIVASSHNVAETYGLTPSDVSLCVMPLFHIHGLIASTLATFGTGGTVVVVPRFNPLSFWSTVREHRVTWYSAVPTIHKLLLSRNKGSARPAGAEQLRFIRSCSAPLTAPLMEELENKFGVPVLEAYGMTEAAHQMSSNPLAPAKRKPGSVGCETGIKIAILDANGELLPDGTMGEVAIKGPSVFSGYEDNPEANATAFTNGWFRTGDQGYLDSDSYLTLVGRIKEMIIRGGEKIAPVEIDEVLASHPSVAEAVCFGVSDRIYGEEVAAAVVLNDEETEKTLLEYCRSLLADFKCPKVIYIVDAIPRTATGKIQRRNVAAEIARPGELT
jgi:acyl-CoA synthetase (AMP-forming)/AMP-acid ligase II